MAPLQQALFEWQNFYIVTGAAGAQLTGLQFIVMALIADMPMRDGDAGASEAFATPTVVHFVAVLMLAASAVVPWHGFRPAQVLIGAGGIAGAIYTALVIVRMMRQNAYKPVTEDWAFHAVLPMLGYLGMTVAAVCLQAATRRSLFGFAAVAVTLLFVGIHNAWDNVTFLVMERRKRQTHKETVEARRAVRN